VPNAAGREINAILRNVALGRGETREAELSYLRLKLRNPDAVSFGVSHGQSRTEKTGGGWPDDAGQAQI